MLATPPPVSGIRGGVEKAGAVGCFMSDVGGRGYSVGRSGEPDRAGRNLLSWRPQLNDPDDEMLLEAAINGRADALVTYNMAHFQMAATRFDVRLARPVEILREVIGP